MSVLSRLGAIFRAKANKAVEAAESSDLSGILAVSLQDEKRHLQEAEQALNEVGGQVKTMEQDVHSLQAASADWGHNAETALAKGNEELAKKALERQASVDHELEVKQQALVGIRASYTKLTNDILAREAKVKEVQGRLSTLKAEEKAADVTLKARATVGAHAGDGNALNQIEVFEQRVREKVNTASAAGEFDAKAKGADVTEAFDDLKKATVVEDRLAVLKAKMAAKAAPVLAPAETPCRP